MRADVHAHVIAESLLAQFARNRDFGFEDAGDGIYTVPGYGALDWGLYRHEKRLQSLADRRIEMQIVSPLPYFLNWPDGAADVEFTRSVNASTAECVASSGGKFAGLAALSLGEPDKAVAELDRAIGEYGFVGVALGTHGGGSPLDAPEFEPLWAEFERRRLLLFMHPNNAEALPRWQDFSLNTVLAWPNETTLAVARLKFSGVLERYPDLQLALAHGGGNLAFMKSRLDLAYHPPKYEYNSACHTFITKPPGDYFDRLYFDTAVGGAEQLRFLIDLVGAERVLFGSDDPFEIADADGAMALPVIVNLPTDQAGMIVGNNLQRILNNATLS
jgi:aminocarboxymuconate-semialdehyde decarboxylase